MATAAAAGVGGGGGAAGGARSDLHGPSPAAPSLAPQAVSSAKEAAPAATPLAAAVAAAPASAPAAAAAPVAARASASVARGAGGLFGDDDNVEDDIFGLGSSASKAAGGGRASQNAGSTRVRASESGPVKGASLFGDEDEDVTVMGSGSGAGDGRARGKSARGGGLFGDDDEDSDSLFGGAPSSRVSKSLIKIGRPATGLASLCVCVFWGENMYTYIYVCAYIRARIQMKVCEYKFAFVRTLVSLSHARARSLSHSLTHTNTQHAPRRIHPSAISLATTPQRPPLLRLLLCLHPHHPLCKAQRSLTLR